MPKLNQILAIEKGEKTKVYGDTTKAHHRLEKAELLSGMSRAYRSKEDDGEKFPNEDQKLQVRAQHVVDETFSLLSGYYDIVAQRDWANCAAKSDIVVYPGTPNEKVLLKDVPAPYLLWLEKQLDDLYTFVSKLPVLPTTEDWVWSKEQDCYQAPAVETAKMKKVSRPMELSPATKEHPAQVHLVTEDVVIGYWTTIKFSGALPAQQVKELRNRVKALHEAAKFAREKANSCEAAPVKTGDALLGFLFRG